MTPTQLPAALPREAGQLAKLGVAVCFGVGVIWGALGLTEATWYQRLFAAASWLSAPRVLIALAGFAGLVSWPRDGGPPLVLFVPGSGVPLRRFALRRLLDEQAIGLLGVHVSVGLALGLWLWVDSWRLAACSLTGVIAFLAIATRASVRSGLGALFLLLAWLLEASAGARLPALLAGAVGTALALPFVPLPARWFPDIWREKP